MRFTFPVAVVALALHASAFAPMTYVGRTSPSTSAAKPLGIQDTTMWASRDNQWEDEDKTNVGLQQQHPIERTSTSKKENRKSNTDPTPVLFSALRDFFKNTKAKQAAAAAVLMLSLSPLPSNAAMSGGRIGGAISAPRQTRVMPSTRSYSSGGGYGRGFSSGYASGMGAGYLSAPRYSYGFSPFMSPFPRPFYSGGYGGGGVISYSRGPTLGQLVFFGGVAFAISQALKSETVDWTQPIDDYATTALGPGNSVAKISIALEVPNRDDAGSILTVLNRLGQNANTESRQGIQSLTSQVALEVLRRKSSIVSASSENRHFNSRTQALREFNNQATKERGKFERENLGSGETGASSKATMAVVTLLISIDGDSTNIPQIRSVADVEQALRSIATDSKVGDSLQGVEILWTPEERSETLSLKDVVADYPTLRAV